HGIQEDDHEEEGPRKEGAGQEEGRGAQEGPEGEDRGQGHRAAPSKARVAAIHGSKESLAKSLADALARDDEDTGIIADRLGKASNTQLLHLQAVVEVVKEKFGSRAKLIEAIGAAEKKSTDKDYLAKLETFSLPHLLDIATSAQRSARA